MLTDTPTRLRAVLLAALLLAASSAQAGWRERDEAIMGTRVSVELWLPEDAQAALLRGCGLSP